MKKIFKKVLKTEKSFEEWTRINNIELNSRAINSKKPDKNRKSYLAIFCNIMVAAMAFVILMPMLYFVNTGSSSDTFLPGKLPDEIIIPPDEPPERPPERPHVPPLAYYAKDVNAVWYTSIESLFDDIENPSGNILLSDTKTSSFSEAYKETLKPSVKEDEPVVSYVVKEWLIICSEEAVLAVDYRILLNSDYYFETYMEYFDLMPMEIALSENIYYKINTFENAAYLNFVHDNLNYFIKLYNANCGHFQITTKITETVLENFIVSKL